MSERSILIVDSDDRTVRMAQEVLSHMCQNKIIAVSTIESAKNILNKEDILFLIIDLSFGKIDGVELIKKIRNNKTNFKNKMPILAILEESYDKDTKNNIINSGVVDFITKPFGTSILQTSILNIVNNPRNFIDCGVYLGPDRRSKNVTTKNDLRKKRNS